MSKHESFVAFISSRALVPFVLETHFMNTVSCIPTVILLNPESASPVGVK